MKDPIVTEIHRHRTAYAKRFNYDVRAIGDDIRRCEAKSGGVFVALNARRKPTVKKPRAKTLAAHK